MLDGCCWVTTGVVVNWLLELQQPQRFFFLPENILQGSLPSIQICHTCNLWGNFSLCGVKCGDGGPVGKLQYFVQGRSKAALNWVERCTCSQELLKAAGPGICPLCSRSTWILLSCADHSVASAASISSIHVCTTGRAVRNADKANAFLSEACVFRGL